MTNPSMRGISDTTAATLLRQERARLTLQRAEHIRVIREHQAAIDAIDKRLQEVEEGEHVLSNGGRRDPRQH